MAEANAETSSPPQKKARLSLSLKKGRRTATNEQFEIVDVAEVESAKQRIIPGNTQATRWAVGAFEDWVSQRNKRSRDQCPPDLLLTDDGELPCKWLCVFVTEVSQMVVNIPQGVSLSC